MDNLSSSQSARVNVGTNRNPANNRDRSTTDGSTFQSYHVRPIDPSNNYLSSDQESDACLHFLPDREHHPVSTYQATNDDRAQTFASLRALLQIQSFIDNFRDRTREYLPGFDIPPEDSELKTLILENECVQQVFLLVNEIDIDGCEQTFTSLRALRALLQIQSFIDNFRERSREYLPGFDIPPEDSELKTLILENECVQQVFLLVNEIDLLHVTGSSDRMHLTEQASGSDRSDACHLPAPPSDRRRSVSRENHSFSGVYHTPQYFTCHVNGEEKTFDSIDTLLAEQTLLRNFRDNARLYNVDSYIPATDALLKILIKDSQEWMATFLLINDIKKTVPTANADSNVPRCLGASYRRFLPGSALHHAVEFNREASVRFLRETMFNLREDRTPEDRMTVHEIEREIREQTRRAPQHWGWQSQRGSTSAIDSNVQRCLGDFHRRFLPGSALHHAMDRLHGKVNAAHDPNNQLKLNLLQILENLLTLPDNQWADTGAEIAGIIDAAYDRDCQDHTSEIIDQIKTRMAFINIKRELEVGADTIEMFDLLKKLKLFFNESVLYKVMSTTMSKNGKPLVAARESTEIRGYIKNQFSRSICQFPENHILQHFGALGNLPPETMAEVQRKFISGIMNKADFLNYIVDMFKTDSELLELIRRRNVEFSVWHGKTQSNSELLLEQYSPDSPGLSEQEIIEGAANVADSRTRFMNDDIYQFIDGKLDMFWDEIIRETRR